MKTMIKLGLLFIGVLLCSSCDKENEMLKQELTTPTTTGTQVTPEEKKPEVKKMNPRYFIGKVFRYGGPKTDIDGLLQVALHHNRITICRRGNVHRLEGYVHKPYQDGVGTKIGEGCASSYNIETGYFSLDIAPDGPIAGSIWLRDIIWLRYNSEKDVLEVKLKTPLAGEGTEPVVYELRRVEKAEYPR